MFKYLKMGELFCIYLFMLLNTLAVYWNLLLDISGSRTHTHTLTPCVYTLMLIINYFWNFKFQNIWPVLNFANVIRLNENMNNFFTNEWTNFIFFVKSQLVIYYLPKPLLYITYTLYLLIQFVSFNVINILIIKILWWRWWEDSSSCQSRDYQIII